MTAIVNSNGTERLISAEDVEEISLKTGQLIKLCRHGQHRGRAAMASVARVSATHLKRYEDTDDPLIIPLDVGAEFEVLLDYPSFAAWLAELSGYDLVKRNAGRGKSLLALMQGSVKEAAEAHEAILEAEADGIKTLDEWRAIKKEAAAGYEATGSDLVVRSSHCAHQVDFRRAGLPLGCNIVSNPPFGIAEDWLKISLGMAIGKVALLLPLTWLSGMKRSLFLEETPLVRVHVLTPRPSMRPGAVILANKKPGGGTKDFAWFVWERGMSFSPEVRFLRREGHSND
ncbi:hypothetical protein SAMN04515647_2215 [Cohaesibacter sp. ES.047]|uniref:hypothetical protein n=1 Tax=Cohaesibacter sp. ES.047 TaxID=1798205 RepID=UPI000BBF6085|nr:hypothetical protein [Cohaesibacter sp. ES.047]SNY91971.1 hypothetical protein SAMN04515647_2215 [Cohaesibacter sp. ES.047]